MTFNSEQFKQACSDAMGEAAACLVLTQYLAPDKLEAHDPFFQKKTRRLRAILSELYTMRQGLEEIHNIHTTHG